MRRARLRLHLRVLVEPDVTIRALIDSCDQAYRPAGLSVDVRSQTTLRLSDREIQLFNTLNVGNGCMGSRVTAEQDQLFALARGIDEREVVIFFVQETFRAVSGCAQHPEHQPGAIVVSACSEWTLAHELGHLLMLTHVDDSRRLMFNRGTVGISRRPPELAADEITTILESPLLH